MRPTISAARSTWPASQRERGDGVRVERTEVDPARQRIEQAQGGCPLGGPDRRQEQERGTASGTRQRVDRLHRDRSGVLQVVEEEEHGLALQRVR